MYKINIILIMLLVSLSFKAHAQQDPHYSFYMNQMGLINPAYAGADNITDITLGVRSQWAGVMGAPESQSAVFSTPLRKNLGVGLAVLRDKTFIESQTWLALNFSYKIKLNEKTNLLFGIKASGNSYNINTEGLITYGTGQDASLNDFNSKFSPNVGIGALLKHQDFYLSLSAPKILSNERLSHENGIASLSDGKQHIYTSIGYNFYLSTNVTLQASTLYRYVAAAPSSLDITALFDFNQKFDLGILYRVDSAFGGLLQFNVSDGFKLGYAYDTPTNSEINGLDNGSHELFMKIEL